MNLKPSKLLLLSALVVVGCGRAATEAEDAQDAVDTTESTSNESALMDLASTDTSSMTCSFTSQQVADAALGRFKNNVKDGACVSATQNGNTVEYVLNACTGKWGKLTVTGTIDVTYTANSDCSVDAHAVGQGLKVNKGVIDLDATAHISKNSSGVETIVVQSHSKGGTDSVQLDHQGHYTVTRDSSTGELCRTLDGNWSTDWSTARANATTSTVASGIKKCGDTCPAAGGKVVHDGFLGRQVTVTFDGSAVAQWSTSKGKSGTVNLDCQP